jgi:hypothetical protein
MQTQMIDQIMDAWEQQLKSPARLQGAAMLPMPALSASGSNDPMADMMRFWEMFPAFRLWMQAAEQWQRQWMPTESSSDQRSRSFKKVA